MTQAQAHLNYCALKLAAASIQNRYNTMATPEEAQKLAEKAVQDYINACNLQTTDRVVIGNHLMKLASVAGVMMAQVEGSVTAAARLYGTAEHILKTMPKTAAKLVEVH